MCWWFVMRKLIKPNQNRDLICRQPPFRNLAAPFAGSALQVPRTFERLLEEGLVGLDYPLEDKVLLDPSTHAGIGDANGNWWWCRSRI